MPSLVNTILNCISFQVHFAGWALISFARSTEIAVIQSNAMASDDLMAREVLIRREWNHDASSCTSYWSKQGY